MQGEKYGGIGLKDVHAWSRAIVAKLVWAIAEKKYMLLVKWVHERYLKDKSWWEYQLALDSNWYWKKLCFIKELFKKGCTNPQIWE